MKSSIKKTGNSKGIILPKSFSNECFVEEDVNIEGKNNRIVISAAVDDKRKNWEAAFKEMANNGDDQLIIPDLFYDEKITGWE